MVSFCFVVDSHLFCFERLRLCWCKPRQVFCWGGKEEKKEEEKGCGEGVGREGGGEVDEEEKKEEERGCVYAHAALMKTLSSRMVSLMSLLFRPLLKFFLF